MSRGVVQNERDMIELEHQGRNHKAKLASVKDLIVSKYHDVELASSAHSHSAPPILEMVDSISM